MTTSKHVCVMHGGEPAIDQGAIAGWDVTWNPDDARFYVERDGRTVATFREWRNTVRYCKTHPAK